MSNIITARDSDIVAAEINTIKENTRRVMISNAIRIGGKLLEAKNMVPFGEWGKWLEEKVDYSQSTAEDLMKLYREYGDNQESLFDNWTKSETFGNLSYSKHLALLALPFAERQEFAEQNDAENLSTRELEARVKAAQQELEQTKQQLDEANARAATAEESAGKSARDAMNAAANLKTREEELQRQLAAAKQAEEASRKKASDLQTKLKMAKAAADSARKEAEQLKENPAVPESMMEQLRKDAAADAAKAAQEEIEKKLAAAQKQIDDAQARAQKVEEDLEAARKAAKLANPEVVAFKVKFDKFQEDYIVLQDDLKDLCKNAPELGEGLTKGLKALLQSWLKALGK